MFWWMLDFALLVLAIRSNRLSMLGREVRVTRSLENGLVSGGFHDLVSSPRPFAFCSCGIAHDRVRESLRRRT